MNVHVSRPAAPPTMTAEGLPRRRWSVSDIERMQDAGIIDRHERLELIGGEIVPMAPKGIPHETLKKELNRFWTKALSPEIDLVTETTLRIGEHDFLEPDFIFWQRSIPLKDVRAEHILLLVEVADSSLSYDLGRKAQNAIIELGELGAKEIGLGRLAGAVGVRELDGRILRRLVRRIRAGLAGRFARLAVGPDLAAVGFVIALAHRSLSPAASVAAMYAGRAFISTSARRPQRYNQRSG